jgi:hypothetical protein
MLCRAGQEDMYLDFVATGAVSRESWMNKLHWLLTLAMPDLPESSEFEKVVEQRAAAKFKQLDRNKV